MNVILVKHINSDKAFWFKLSPLKASLAKKGDLLLVDTRFGQKLAIAVSNPIKLDDGFKNVLEQSGATFPLKPVLTVCTTEMFAHIVNSTINVCINRLNKIRPKDELPY